MKHNLRSLWVVITDDRRKATLLASLLVILLGFAVKSMVMGNGPRRSSASTSGAGEAAVTDVGQSAVNRAIALLGSGSSRAVITLPPTPGLSRNLFAFNEEYFPPPPQTDPNEPLSKATMPASIEGRPENADESRARIEARVQVKADTLKLRSVVLGTNPIAVFEIPGIRQRQVVPLGRRIEGFTLEEVAGNSVLLEMDSVRVRLFLFRPEK